MDTDEQKDKALANVTKVAQVVCDVLEFPHQMVDGTYCLCRVMKAYFLGIMGWAYWADYPTVSSPNFTGIELVPNPASFGANVAGFCWSVLSHPEQLKSFVEAGRNGDAPTAFNFLCNWRPDKAQAMRDVLSVLNGVGAPEPVIVSPVPVEPEPEPVEPEPETPVAASVPATPAPVPEPAPEPTPVVIERHHTTSKTGDTINSLATGWGYSPMMFRRLNPELRDPIPVGTIIWLAP